MESDSLVTKATIILERPSQWEAWLFLRRTTAEQHKIWKYCDPDQTAASLPKLEEPVRPRFTDYKASATRFADLNESERSAFQFEYKLYEQDLALYTAKEKAIGALSAEIAKTVGKDHLFHIYQLFSAAERLRKLKTVFAPSEATRNRELLTKYKDLQNTQRGNQVEAWLDSWLRITNLIHQAKLPEASGTRAQEDFLISVHPLAPEWSDIQIANLFDKEESEKDDAIPTVEYLINQFRKYWRRTKPIQASLGTFGTLAVAQLDTSPLSPDAKPSDGKRKGPKLNNSGKPQCLCNDWHWYSECPYIVESARLRNWTPKAGIVEKFQAKRKAHKWFEIACSKAIKKAQQSSSPSSSANLDQQEASTDWDAGARSQASNNTAFATQLVRATFNASDSSHRTGTHLLNRWILDPGSNCHVANSTAFGWIKTSDAQKDDIILAGNQPVPVDAWGEVHLYVETREGHQRVRLTQVALIPTFFTNILSLSRIEEQSISFDSGRNVLYQHNYHNIIALLQKSNGHWLVDSHKNERPSIATLGGYQVFAAAPIRRQAPKPSHEHLPDLQLTGLEAHRLLGHPSQRAIQKLTSNVEGIKLLDDEAPQWTQCKDCIHAKMTKKISRRPSPPATRPLQRLGLDLLQLRSTGEECLNGDRWALHAVCQFSGFHLVETLKSKARAVVMPALKGMIALAQRRYNQQVVFLRVDNDTAYTRELAEWATELGITIEPRAEHTEEQNGLSERAGRSIITTARALRIQGNLPKNLTNELVRTAVYLLNRTPTERNDWRTPFEVLEGKQPSLAHLHEIGYKAFTRNPYQSKGDKLESRVFVGYLTGYEGNNIFRIWLPSKERVIRTRDVVFLPRTNGMDDQRLPNGDQLERIIEVLDIPDADPVSDDLIDHLLNPTSDHQFIPPSSEKDIQHQIDEEARKKSHVQLPTPSESRASTQTPPAVESDDEPEDITTLASPVAPTQIWESSSITQESRGMARGKGEPRQTDKGKSSVGLTWKGYEEVNDDRVPDRSQNNAPNRWDPTVGSSHNIVEGKRTRRPPATQTAYYHAAFSAAILNSTNGKPTESSRLHRDQLPPVPKSYKKLHGHRFEHEFREAMQMEIQTCWNKDCFALTDVTQNTATAEVLPLMWVYTYKFDEDGYLYKFKARLVVRGDLQSHQEETYAATLAAKVFRALIALMSAFGLLGFQYDATNAFLNARLERELYVLTPEGYKEQYGQLLLLRKALYGLKEAPLLWYREISKALKEFGLQQVPDVPCLFTNKHIIVFFYVDDIVVLVHPSKFAQKQEFEQWLIGKYEMKILGEINWFLGIRVLRHPLTHQISLIQDSFIDKVATKYNLALPSGRYPQIPLTVNHLEPSSEPFNQARTKRFQELNGCLGFITGFTRPDVSRAHSLLARQNQNPSTEHLKHLEHAWRYIIGKRNFAVSATGDITRYEASTKAILEPEFFGASDAAFGDDFETRRSSQGFVFKLYGMPIDWSARLQRSVTKSTTEAELLALSLAGSEMEWWNRFFKHVGYDPEITPTLWCDNQQTVGLVAKDSEKLKTKLKHVDIHSSWVRQEVSKGRLHVDWKATSVMPADGFTKCLPRQKHEEFCHQLGLLDITKMLKGEELEASPTPLTKALRHWY